MFYFKLLFIIFAVSVDGFGVGIIYGMRKIRISIIALIIIMCVSGIIVSISMTIGQFLQLIISPKSAHMIGSLILIFLGIFILFTNLQEKFGWRFFNKEPFTKIITSPEQADKDQSGTISGGESIILGFALAMDAFGAGLAAAMLHYSISITAILVALMSGMFLYSGAKLGHLFAASTISEKLTYLPAILLISIGIVNLLS